MSNMVDRVLRVPFYDHFFVEEQLTAPIMAQVRSATYREMLEEWHVRRQRPWRRRHDRG